MFKRNYYTYIITNYTNNVFYIGVTNNLLRRIEEHRTCQNEGFSKRYKLYKLVYFDYSNDIHAAIEHEKKLKKYRRQQKIDLIKSMNPNFDDLYVTMLTD